MLEKKSIFFLIFIVFRLALDRNYEQRVKGKQINEHIKHVILISVFDIAYNLEIFRALTQQAFKKLRFTCKKHV